MDQLAVIKAKKEISKAITYLLLLIFSTAFIFPFIWMISVSLQTEEEMRMASGFFSSLIPSSWRFQNYLEVFQIVPFARYFRNSAIVTLSIAKPVDKKADVPVYA